MVLKFLRKKLINIVKNTDLKFTTMERNANTLLVTDGFNKYKVIVRRKYYGEIQEEERIIEGESFERAKFYFNISSIDWSVVASCK